MNIKKSNDVHSKKQKLSYDRERNSKFQKGTQKTSLKCEYLLNKKLFLTSIITSLVSYSLYNGIIYALNIYQMNQVVSPLNLPKVIVQDIHAERSHHLFWGSYRPGQYFGMKHRSSNSLLFGVIWGQQNVKSPAFRHDCDQNNGVKSYYWLEHDGQNFGTQQIIDTHHVITISFVKPMENDSGTDWIVRINAVSRKPETTPLSIAVYFYNPSYNEDISKIIPQYHNRELIGLQGFSPELNVYMARFYRASKIKQRTSCFTNIPREDAIMHTFYENLIVRRDNGLFGFSQSEKHDAEDNSNALFYEITVDPPFARDGPTLNDTDHAMLEVQFFQPFADVSSFSEDLFTQYLREKQILFNEQFHKKFAINTKIFSEKEVNLTKIVVSNLLGGMGYFHGSSMIKADQTKSEPILGFPANLFTATPSRSMFPRGFLWDEGFHGLVLTRWNPLLAMDVVGYWLDLLNMNGWIPREQILGWEARSRVPKEFVIQSDSVANPPTLILVIESLIDSLPNFSALELAEFNRWSQLVLPRLDVWYQWFNRTQMGKLPLSYRWHGRVGEDSKRLNPLTLSSGLDDYPRASHPSDDERHLDLRCWMTYFAKVMSRFIETVSKTVQIKNPEDSHELTKLHKLYTVYQSWADQLSNQTELDKLHWSEDLQRYADYGLHTDSVRLVDQINRNNKQIEKIRVVDSEPSLGLITSAFGYVSFFPLFLRILAPTSPRLPMLLSDLSRKDVLWTDYGLRSLNPNSPYYQKPNTKDDPPYWRGAIWINMNYLAVQSLRFYSQHPDTPVDVARQSKELASQLSLNLVRNVLGELDRTNYLWEQYNDLTGRGQRGHPFCGWTCLISLIISDF